VISTVLTVARFAYELGSELWQERKRAKAKERAQRQWANTPTSVRACAQCGTLAYQPGQSRCYHCGGPVSY
jgi:lipopolysaccharide biosynthesis regulator YciM